MVAFAAVVVVVVVVVVLVMLVVAVVMVELVVVNFEVCLVVGSSHFVLPNHLFNFTQIKEPVIQNFMSSDQFIDIIEKWEMQNQIFAKSN